MVFSASLDPISVSNLLTIKFSLDVRFDPQLSGVSQVIALLVEVFGELGCGSQRFQPSRDPALPAAGHRAPVIPVPG